MKEQNLQMIIRDILKGWNNYTLENISEDNIEIHSQSKELLIYLLVNMSTFEYIDSIFNKYTIFVDIINGVIKINKK